MSQLQHFSQFRAKEASTSWTAETAKSESLLAHLQRSSEPAPTSKTSADCNLFPLKGNSRKRLIAEQSQERQAISPSYNDRYRQHNPPLGRSDSSKESGLSVVQAKDFQQTAVSGMTKRPTSDCLSQLGSMHENFEADTGAKKSKFSHSSETIIPSPVIQPILPDYNTVGMDPDVYMCQLVEALYGVKLQQKSGLDLKGFFPPIAETQYAAYNLEVVSACRERNMDALRYICETKGRQALDCFNRFGESLLNLACRRGFNEIVSYLLSGEVGLNVRMRDDYGRTPLHDACWNPSPLIEICSWILEKEPALFFIRDKRGYTPFQYARKSDWLVWRKFLFDHHHLLAPLVSPEILKDFS